MSGQAPGQQHNSSISDAQRALQNVLSHPAMTLEQKIDAFKKLRMDNKITEQVFQQIVRHKGIV